MGRAKSGGEVLIGTSGWHYGGWWGPFFPAGLKKKDALVYYASQFVTCELNAPFYRTPTLEAVRAWAEQTPPDFRFAWKASKFITHWKRLSERCANSIELLESRLVLLGEKCGPILFQLPPKMAVDVGRLESFIGMLNRKRRYAFEFRHHTWYTDAVYDVLSRYDMSLCLSDHHDAPAPWEVTASWVYVRPHGPGGRYRDHYDDPTLARWARRMKAWVREGRDVYCYFDNDQKSAAPFDARRLIELVLGKRALARAA